MIGLAEWTPDDVVQTSLGKSGDTKRLGDWNLLLVLAALVVVLVGFFSKTCNKGLNFTLPHLFPFDELVYTLTSYCLMLMLLYAMLLDAIDYFNASAETWCKCDGGCAYPHTWNLVGPYAPHKVQGKMSSFVDPALVAPQNSERNSEVRFGGVTIYTWIWILNWQAQIRKYPTKWLPSKIMLIYKNYRPI